MTPSQPFLQQLGLALKIIFASLCSSPMIPRLKLHTSRWPVEWYLLGHSPTSAEFFDPSVFITWSPFHWRKNLVPQNCSSVTWVESYHHLCFVLSKWQNVVLLLVIEAALYVWDSVLQEASEHSEPWRKWGGTPQVVAILHANNYRDIESDKQGGRGLWRRLWSYEVVILLQENFYLILCPLCHVSHLGIFQSCSVDGRNLANHLGCIKHCKQWDMDTISTGDRRISSINRSVLTDDVLWCRILPFWLKSRYWSLYLWVFSSIKVPPPTNSIQWSRKISPLIGLFYFYLFVFFPSWSF